jgi:uncharacterized protein with FMN-binding domain
MGIPLYGMNVVTDSECIDCMNCVDVCPRDNVKANPRPALATAVAVAALSGMYFAGNIASSAAAAQSIATVAQASETQSGTVGQYIDGVYTGSGNGFRGTTQVQVTILSGYITDITVLSTGDDSEFFNKAEGIVTAQILSSQSVSVDTVSGATFSSNGIIEAVTNALSSALRSTSAATTTQEETTNVPATQQTTSETAVVPNTTETAQASASNGPIALEDGTYSGSGNGFRGETSVSVMIENGYITSIEVTGYNDDEQFFSRAETTIIKEILAGQTPDVDAVSGATYSSNGIMEAVANALNLEITVASPVQDSHGGHGRH